MNKVYEKVKTCLASVREKTDFVPEVALILGSGLGDYADQIKIETTIEYTEIEGFPTSTVAGHKGRFVFGYVDEVPVVIMQGRVHYYEGYPMTDVVLPTRLMGMMGAKKLILTNAAGGVNLDYKPGDFMLITDHITTGIPSPLIGKNIDEFGPRFPDMSEVYSLRMRNIIKEEAEKLIREIPQIEGLWIGNEKQREEKYRECMKSCKCAEWVRIIKTLYERKVSRLKQGKKITATDERYLRMAEEPVLC